MFDGASTIFTSPFGRSLQKAKVMQDDTLAALKGCDCEDLYRILHRRVYAYALFLSKDKGIAEDLMQEAFLRFYSHQVAVVHSEHAYGWLVTVVKNLVIDRSRHLKMRPSVADDWIIDSLVDTAPSQEEVVILRQRLDHLQKLVEELDGLNKECIILYAQGLKFQEIADTLGISLSTAINKTMAGMKRMNRSAVRLKY